MEYFSDKELGQKARVEKEISPTVWGGIVAHINSLVSNGAFGEHFPDICPDGASTVGTDEQAFSQSLKAEVPDIDWPLVTKKRRQEGFFSEEIKYSPKPFVVLDLIQFCYMHVAKPTQCGYHKYFQHHHLSFDSDAGKHEFREKINRIFYRNALAYELEESGEVKRLSSPILGEEFESIRFNTGDKKLDEILQDTRKKYLSPNPELHKEAVERLWDAWERLKTQKDPSNKKKSIKLILDDASANREFRALLEEEATKLTCIGNSFHIRHSEVTQTEITEMEHYDYLLHRLLSMILLLTKTMT
jgi:hypothetical protein